MRIFLDTGSPTELEALLGRGFITGVTTNPSHLAKAAVEHSMSPDRLLREMASVLAGTGLPLNVQVMRVEGSSLREQANWAIEALDYADLVLKVGASWDALPDIAHLTGEGIAINVTAIMNLAQSILAREAGARYVSFFWGKSSDGGADPARMARAIVSELRSSSHVCELIIGSLRTPYDLIGMSACGADIVTVRLEDLTKLMHHPISDEAAGQFAHHYSAFGQPV